MKLCFKLKMAHVNMALYVRKKKKTVSSLKKSIDQTKNTVSLEN